MGKTKGALTAMDEARTDEVDIADVMSTVRLMYKTVVKKDEKMKKGSGATHFMK